MEMTKKNGITNTLTIMALMIAPQVAFAAATPIEGAIDWLLDLLTNGLARTVAILAIVSMGYLAFAGKLAIELVGKFILGIVLIFGGAAIVDLLIAAADV